jgi:hypothetical protein
MANDELKILVKAEVDKAVADLKRVDGSMTQTGKSAGNAAMSFGKVAGAVGGAVLAIRTAINVSRQLVDAYRVQEQAEAKLAGVLRATGEAAGFNSRQLRDMASGLQGLTTFGDEAILGMQSLLLTFKSIQGEAFERTTELALDLSAAFDQDLKSSAMQLGKALEDPERGLTALRRVGVSFTESQEEMIKGLVEAGELAEAQGIILDTLEQQVGGVAQTMAATATGELTQLTNALGDMRERGGKAVLDFGRPFITWLRDVVTESNDAAAALDNLKAALAADVNPSSGEFDIDAAIETQQERIAAAEVELETQRELAAAMVRQGRISEATAEQSVRMRENTIRNLRDELYELERRKAQLRAEAKAVQEELDRLEAERLEREEAARRQAAVDQAFTDARSVVLGILESEKSERDKIIEQIEYLEAHPWAAGSPQEADRLEALEILTGKLEDIAWAAVLADHSLRAMSSGLAGAASEARDLFDATAWDDSVFGGGETTPMLDLTGFAEAFEQGYTDVMEVGEAWREWEAEQEELRLAQSLAMYQEYYDARIAAAEQTVSAEQKILDEFSENVRDIFDDDMLARAFTGAMTEMGRAIADGTDAMDAMGSVLANVASDILGQISMYATLAAVKVVAMSPNPLAAIPLAVGLLAIAGVTGIASGFIGATGGGGGPDTSWAERIVAAEESAAEKRLEIIRDQLEDERRIRDEHLAKLESSFNQEFEILRDAWERNLISTEEFRAGMGDLNAEHQAGVEEANEPVVALETEQDKIEKQQAALEAARTTKLQALAQTALALQEELNGMSGWDKFWSGRDEEIVKELDALDRRRQIVETATDMETITSAAKGANFLTSGPELLLVGDNASGREHVMVNPAPGAGGMGIAININAPVYGMDDLYEKLEEAGRRLQRRGRVA